MNTILACSLIAVFVGLALTHLYWLFGGRVGQPALFQNLTENSYWNHRRWQHSWSRFVWHCAPGWLLVQPECSRCRSLGPYLCG